MTNPKTNCTGAPDAHPRAVTMGSLLVALGVVAAGAAGFLVYAWMTADPPRKVFMGQELDKSVLQLGLISVGGGIVGFLLQRYNADKDWYLKNQDATKQAHAATLGVQSDLIGRLVDVANTVRRAPSLIEAHRSAKTYGEQMRLAIDARFELERWSEEGALLHPKVFGEWDVIKTGVDAMVEYLKKLEVEFRKEYPALSKLQGQAVTEKLKDELWQRLGSLPMIKDMLGPDEPSKSDSTQFVTEFLIPYRTAMVAMKRAVAQRQNLIQSSSGVGVSATRSASGEKRLSSKRKRSMVSVWRALIRSSRRCSGRPELGVRSSSDNANGS